MTQHEGADWTHQDPPGKSATPPQYQRVACGVCGTKVSKHRLALHKDSKACLDALLERTMQKQGWEQANRKWYGIYEEAGVEVFKVKKTWVPGWVHLIMYTLKQKGLRNVDGVLFLEFFRDNEAARNLLPKFGAVRVHNKVKRRISDVELLLLLSGVPLTMTVVGMKKPRRFSYRLLYSWTKWLGNMLLGSRTEFTEVELDLLEALPDRMVEVVDRCAAAQEEPLHPLYDYGTLARRRRDEVLTCLREYRERNFAATGS